MTDEKEEITVLSVRIGGKGPRVLYNERACKAIYLTGFGAETLVMIAMALTDDDIDAAKELLGSAQMVPGGALLLARDVGEGL